MKKIIIVISILAFNASQAQVNTLKESIFFGIGKSSLTQAHKAKLDSVVILLKASKNYDGEIKGYTCNIGSTSLNKLISNLRALNVYNYLVDRGAKRKSFSYKGYGIEPNGNNTTAYSRAQHRRTDVEILLSLFDESANVDEDIPVKTQSIGTKTTTAATKVYSPISQATSSGTSTTRVYIPNSSNSTIISNGGTTEYTPTTINSSSKEAESRIITKPRTAASTSVSTTTTSNKVNSTSESIPANTLEFGPDFNMGKMPMAGNKIISSSNGIKINLDKNTFVSTSKEPIELDFKDYTQNFDIIKKGIQTKSNGKEMKLLGAFNVNFTQDFQELPINSTKPVILSIPGEYDPEMKLYSNHRNWQLDTVNKFSYNEETKSYEISVINNNQMIGLLKPIESEIIKHLKVKIKGLNPELIKPYIIYDNCLISQGQRLKGKWFIFPITQISETYRLRAQHIDYTSKAPAFYSLEFDVVNLAPVGNLKTDVKKGEIIELKLPSKIYITPAKLLQANLCDTPIEPATK